MDVSVSNTQSETVVNTAHKQIDHLAKMETIQPDYSNLNNAGLFEERDKGIDPEEYRNRKYRAQELFRKRFLLMPELSGKKTFVDVQQGAFNLGSSAVAGALAHECEINFQDAQDLVRNCFGVPWSGKFIYDPNTASPVLVLNGLYCLNKSRPSQYPPESKVALVPFYEFLAICIPNENERNYFLGLLAYRFQNMNPDKKPPHALYLYSRHHGVGKSFLADILCEIFGHSNSKKVAKATELSAMNSVEMLERDLLVVEECNINKNYKLKDLLKAAISNDSMDATKKYKGAEKYRTPALILMTSNNLPDWLEPDDRRVLCIEWGRTLGEKQASFDFEVFAVWLNAGGYESVAYLLKKVNWKLLGYEPFKRVLMTDIKRQCTDQTNNPIVEAIEEAIHIAGKLMFTTDSFKGILQEYRVPTNEWNKHLMDAGLVDLGRKAINGSKRRHYIKQGFVLLKKGKDYVVENSAGLSYKCENVCEKVDEL